MLSDTECIRREVPMKCRLFGDGPRARHVRVSLPFAPAPLPGPPGLGPFLSVLGKPHGASHNAECISEFFRCGITPCPSLRACPARAHIISPFLADSISSRQQEEISLSSGLLRVRDCPFRKGTPDICVSHQNTCICVNGSGQPTVESRGLPTT